MFINQEKEEFKYEWLNKNVTKVQKLERKIPSVCKDKTIQFNNKWKSTDLRIIV